MPQRVLVIEDDDAGRTLVGQILQHAGFEFELAPNGSIALQSLAKSRPDGIILDLVMPEMDGMEFLMQARNLPGAAGVPVIVLSTSYLGDLLVGTLGVQAAVSKPFELDHLLTVVRRVFGEDADT